MTVINVWINIDSSDIFQEGLKHTIQVKLCQGVTMAYWGASVIEATGSTWLTESQEGLLAPQCLGHLCVLELTLCLD